MGIIEMNFASNKVHRNAIILGICMLSLKCFVSSHGNLRAWFYARKEKQTLIAFKCK